MPSSQGSRRAGPLHPDLATRTSCGVRTMPGLATLRGATLSWSRARWLPWVPVVSFSRCRVAHVAPGRTAGGPSTTCRSSSRHHHRARQCYDTVRPDADATGSAVPSPAGGLSTPGSCLRSFLPLTSVLRSCLVWPTLTKVHVAYGACALNVVAETAVTSHPPHVFSVDAARLRGASRPSVPVALPSYARLEKLGLRIRP